MMLLKLIIFQIKPIALSLKTFLSMLPIVVKKKCLFKYGFRLTNNGKVNFGHCVRIYSGVIIGIAKNACLTLGSNNVLNSNVKIKISSESSLTIGAGVSLGANTVMLVKGKWFIEDKANVSGNCSIFSREKQKHGDLFIGENSSIGDNTLIDVCDNVTVGRDVAIGPGCKIYSHDHHYDDISIAAWKGNIFSRPVVISDESWIGANVIILPGVKIGKHAVIAAGSVVNRDVPEYELYGGVPARYLKSLNKL